MEPRQETPSSSPVDTSSSSTSTSNDPPLPSLPPSSPTPISTSTQPRRPPNNLPAQSTGSIPTEAALQSAGVLPASTGEPNSPPSPFTTATSTSTSDPRNDLASPLPFSTSVPYSKVNFGIKGKGKGGRPLSAEECGKSKEEKVGGDGKGKGKTNGNGNGDEKGVGGREEIPAQALFPSPSGGFVPPPDVDGKEWKLKEAPLPRSLARGGPVEGEVKDGEGEVDGSKIDRSQTPKVSSLQQQTKDSQPPTRPPSLPASSQTAELIATAPSSSSSRRTSQASPLLRPISTSSLNSHRSSLNSMLLSRSSSNDKRRKSGLSNTSSQLSPTDSSFQGASGSKRQSFNLNDQGSESGNGLVGIGPSSSSPIKNGSSKSSRRVSRSSNSGVQDGESSERPLSSISADTALGNVSTTVGSPNPTHEPHQNDSLDEPSSSSWDDSSNRNSTSNRLSNLPIPPPLKIRDFAFSESDPRHVGARDLSIPEERLSTGYGNNSRLSSEEKEEEDEWGPDAHEHSYEDDEEFQEERSEVGLPEGCYQVIYPFEAESEHELSVSQGMKVMVVGALEGGWAIVQKILDDNGEGDRGLVPEGYLEWLGPVE